jgi:hypothetical protein
VAKPARRKREVALADSIREASSGVEKDSTPDAPRGRFLRASAKGGSLRLHAGSDGVRTGAEIAEKRARQYGRYCALFWT